MASTTSNKLPSYRRHAVEEEDGWSEVFRAAEWTPNGRNGWPSRSKRCRLRWPQAKVGGLRKARVVSAAVKWSLAELLKRLREAKPPCLGQLIAGKFSSIHAAVTGSAKSLEAKPSQPHPAAKCHI